MVFEFSFPFVYVFVFICPCLVEPTGSVPFSIVLRLTF